MQLLEISSSICLTPPACLKGTAGAWLRADAVGDTGVPSFPYAGARVARTLYARAFSLYPSRSTVPLVSNTDPPAERARGETMQFASRASFSIVVPKLLPESLSLPTAPSSAFAESGPVYVLLIRVLRSFSPMRLSVNQSRYVLRNSSLAVMSLSIVRDGSQLQVLPDLRRLAIAVTQPLPASSDRSLGRHSHGTKARRAGGTIPERRPEATREVQLRRSLSEEAFAWLGGQECGITHRQHRRASGR